MIWQLWKSVTRQLLKIWTIPYRLSDGEAEFWKQRNPFYVSQEAGLICVAAGVFVATLIFVPLVLLLQANLERSIRNADILTHILNVSPFYPDKPPSKEVAKNGGQRKVTVMDDLAVATWIQNFKLAPPQSSIKEILGDDQLKLLVGALRYGGHCEGVRGELQPLSMSSVDRLVEFGAFFSDNCDTRSGQSVRKKLADDLVQGIAAGGYSGKDIVKIIMRANSVYDGLELKPNPLVAPEVVKASKEREQADTLKKEAEADPALKNANDPKNAAAKLKLVEAAKSLEDANVRLIETQAKTIDTSADLATSYQARLLLFTTSQLKVSNDAKDLLEDPPLRAIELFAISLVAAIDSDPAVTKARQWLAAVWGTEQYLIFTLFLITASLMIERHLRFGRDRQEVVARIGELQNEVERNQDGDDNGKDDAGETPQSWRRRERDSQAAMAFRRLKLTDGLLRTEDKGGAHPSELVTDMLRATRSDLSQIHLYGLSDERVDKVAEDLKEKIDASRQVIEWGVATLPALGFLGTVRGILIALSAVGGLSQGDSAARLGALLSVSNALGLAFATTLIALVCLIILSYFDIRQARGEKALVDGLRDFLNDRVLP